MPFSQGSTMTRVLLAVVLLAVLLGGLYQLYGPAPTSPLQPPALSSAKRVVSDAGCGSSQSVTFDLRSASVGVPVGGPIGHHDACEGDDIEHLSGEIDWGDGTSSPIVPGDYLGKDKDVLIAARHTYAKSATYPLFARIRAQCTERNGQSARLISCGSGKVEVR
jgi:hypothetical protein